MEKTLPLESIPIESITIATYEVIHSMLMPYLWTLIIDISIFFAMYRHKAINIYIHAVIAMLVTLITLITTILIILKDGIPNENDENYDPLRFNIGLAVLFIVFFQVILGIISKILQLISWSSPSLIYLLNALHKYIGYTLTILGKIQVFLVLDLNIKKVDLFWRLIIFETIIIFVWIICKIYVFKLESGKYPKNLQVKREIRSINEIKEQFSYIGIFANYVYDLKPLLYNHPNGFKIIESVMGRELDRYLYGTQINQSFPIVHPNSHSFKSFQLLNNPIAKICIPSIYTHLNEDINQVQVYTIQPIHTNSQLYLGSHREDTFNSITLTNSSKCENYHVLSPINLLNSSSNIYELKLKGKESIVFKGYTDVCQLGKHFALTIDDKITRLYTVMGFLHPKNVEFLKKHLKYSYIEPENNSKIVQKNQITTDSNLSLDYVSLLVKQNKKGKMTSRLISKNFKKIQLSSERGEGLCFDDINPGKVILVAGGTGLYPFSDLIDLLYKQELAKSKPYLHEKICKCNPLLQSKPFKSFTFHIFLAVKTIEDIHPITLAELIQLCKLSDVFRLTLKCQQEGALNYLQIENKLQITHERFEQIVLNEMKKQDYSKVFICGPLKMTQSMIRVFSKQKIQKDLYKFL